MKDNILHDLYYGKVIPWERKTSEMPEYQAVQEKIDTAFSYFENNFSHEDCTRIEDFRSLIIELATVDEVDIFVLGVKLGTKIALEATNNDPEISKLFNDFITENILSGELKNQDT